MTGNRLRAPADTLGGPAAARAAVWTRIAQQFSACARDLRRALAVQAAACDLTDTEFLLLFVCREMAGDGLAQQEIAEALGVSPPQVSGLVDRLQERGLVQHRRSGSDRRRQLWTLTAEGQRRLTAALDRFDALAHQLDQRLSPRDRARVEQLVASVRNCVQEASSSAAAAQRADGAMHRKAS